MTQPQRAPARRYRFRDHADMQVGRKGDYTLKRGVEVDMWTPSWNHTYTTFRPFPVPSPEDSSQLCGYRLTAEPGDFDDWIRSYPVARAMGMGSPVTFILYDPTEDTYDVASNPVWILYNAVTDAMQSGNARPHWTPYTQRQQGKGVPLHKPSTSYFMQGALMQHNSKDLTQGWSKPPRGGSPEDKLLVQQISPSAFKEQRALLNQEKQSWDCEPDDWENRFVYGDPVALEHGRYITWYQVGAPDPTQSAQQAQQAPSATFGQSRGGVQGSGANQRIGYECRIMTHYNGATACLTHVADMVRSKVRPWDELIHIPTHEEQVQLLSKAFPPDMIAYAFQDHPDLIPDSVREKLGNPTSHQVPAGVPQGGWGGQPAQQEQAAPWGGQPAAPSEQPAPQNDPAARPGWGAPAPSPGADAGAPAQPAWGPVQNAAGQDPAVPTTSIDEQASRDAPAPGEASQAAPQGGRRRRRSSPDVDSARRAVQGDDAS